MVGRKLPKALTSNPKPFVDISAGLMNVPKSMGDLPASGVDFTVGGTVKARKNGNGKKGFKEGKREGQRLTKLSRKRASKVLRK